jgi:cellulose synthase/poly-beta-1,6-N-acetylglucosamine synthase-like glycosyltransferase
MLAAILAASASLIIYTYLLYPAVLWLLTFWRKPESLDGVAGEPKVSLVVAAYNEIAVIAEKLENALVLAFPQEKLEVIAVSDCSDDGTDEAILAFRDRGVKFHRMERQSGKTLAQNAAVRFATGEILVFSDANSIFAPDALAQLLRPFADAKVGAVCGELRYRNPGEQGAGKGEGLYWRYERFLKRRESLLSSTLGANGGIYAVRRALFEELEQEIISDFVMPVRVWRKGFRVVYASDAVAVETTGATFKDEFRRRRRIIARSWYGLWRESEVLNPLRHGFFAWQMFSHKVMRWLVPVFMAIAFLTNLLLATHTLFLYLLYAQLAFYAMAVIGSIDTRLLGRTFPFYLPAYFCATNLGALFGLWSFLTGRRVSTWKPVERR